MEPGKPPQEKTQSNQQKSAIELRGTAQLPLVVRSIKSKEEAAQDTRDREDKTSTEWWMMIFSGAVAIGAFLQAAALFVIIRTTRNQLRAYVFVTEVKIMKLPERTEPSIFVQFTNTGQTPAYKLTIMADKKVDEWPLRVNLSSEHASTRVGSLGAALTSHVELTGFSLIESERQQMSEGKLAVYVFGLIEYKDAFFGWRWTKFRFFGGGGAPTPNGKLAVHATGNDAN